MPLVMPKIVGVKRFNMDIRKAEDLAGKPLFIQILEKIMKIFKRILLLAGLVLAVGVAGFMNIASADEAPYALVKRISQDVIDTAKSDKAIQAGDQKKVMDLVETKILPYVDFQRMTSLAAGRFWREATPEQQKQLTDQFRTLLIYTYSGAIAQIRDHQVQFARYARRPGRY